MNPEKIQLTRWCAFRVRLLWVSAWLHFRLNRAAYPFFWASYTLAKTCYMSRYKRQLRPVFAVADAIALRVYQFGMWQLKKANLKWALVAAVKKL